MDSECFLSNYTLDRAGAMEQLYSTFDVVAIVGLMPAILCLGIVTNVAFLLMLYRVPKMRSFTNFYLANLAVSDIIFLLFGISSKIHQYRMAPVNISPVYGGVFGCLLKFFLVDLSYFASLFMVTLVSVEKFYAICKPIQHRRVNGWVRAVKLSVCSWVVSLVFAVAVIPKYITIKYACIIWPQGQQFDNLSNRYSYCHSPAHWALSYSNIFQTVPFFTTFVVNTIMYALIVKRLTERVQQPLGRRPNNARFPLNAIKTRNQAAKMLVINGIIFFLLLAPFETVSVLLSTDLLADKTKRSLLQICRLLSYFNSAINPFIYGMVNSRYRHAYRVAFSPNRRNRVNSEPGHHRQSNLASLQGERIQET